MGGNQRCSSKEEAETIYATLLAAVSNDRPIVELELGGNKFCARTKDITAFGIMVHLEETAEEIKRRQIEAIESGVAGVPTQSYGSLGYADKSAYCGSGLL